MKQLKSAFLMLTVLVMALSSCKKDKNEEVSGSFSAKISGTTRNGMMAPTAVLMSSENSLQILGQFTTTSGISIMITNPGVGTFDVASENIIATYSVDGTFDHAITGDSGTVKITEYTNSKVKGTFEFTGTDESGSSVVISEGKFEANITRM